MGCHTGYRLAPFYDMLNELVYGDTGMALFIGEEEYFAQVGRHSWEALCADCGFRQPEVLTLFRKTASALLPAWRKVRSEIDAHCASTVAKADLLGRMGQVVDKKESIRRPTRKQIKALCLLARGNPSRVLRPCKFHQQQQKGFFVL